MEMRHPIQPIEKDDSGVLRFKKNAIVEYLLDSGGITMNDIAMSDFSNEDRQQLAQLIGYSLSGYGDLSYVDEYAYKVAETMADEDMDGKDARIEYLEHELLMVRESLRVPIARLYGVHTDDLKG